VGAWGASRVWFIDLLEHFFYANANLLALFGESVDFAFDRAGVLLVSSKFFAERGNFSLGGGTGFAFFLDDLYGAEDFLFERLKLVCTDTGADGGGTHISMSIDGENRDSPEGNLGGI
jgi:hypothetical protein